MPKYDLLNGVRVLDLTVALSGPFAMQVLGDLGAEVIRLEAPKVGDLTRDTFPRLGERDGYYFIALNRNKKSIEIDLQTESGHKAFEDLVKVSDVVFSNLRRKALEHLGVNYENLRKINQSIIFCCLTGFGKDGPYADYPAFDDVVQGLSGVSSLTTDDMGAPVRTAVGSGDISAAMYCVVGILAALYSRKETGCGAEINTSMLAANMSFIGQLFQYYFVSHKLPPRMGTKHPAIAAFGYFKTKNSWIALGPSWSRVARAINRSDLIDNPEYKEPVDRFLHKNELNAEIQAALSEIDTDDLLNIFRSEDIPAGPVNDLKQVESDPQVRHAQIIRTMNDPSRGELTIIDCPIRLAGTDGVEHTAPPLLGQHTDELLSTVLAYSAEQISKMKQEADKHSEELLQKSVRRETA